MGLWVLLVSNEEEEQTEGAVVGGGRNSQQFWEVQLKKKDQQSAAGRTLTPSVRNIDTTVAWVAVQATAAGHPGGLVFNFECDYCCSVDATDSIVCMGAFIFREKPTAESA